MNLILLLSALLSALGGGMGARAPVTPAALSSSVIDAVKATSDARREVSARPVQLISGPAASVVAVLSDFALADPVPVFAGRRRE